MTDPRWPLRVCPIFYCHLWEGPLDADGYGRIGRDLAHRVIWTELRGPIPPGMELDHACRVRACQNVMHLELVTRSENSKRKSWRHRVRRKACPQGHDLKLHGMVTRFGGIVCRRCGRGENA